MNPIKQASDDLHRIEAHGYLELAERGRMILGLLVGYHAVGYPSSGHGGRSSDHADTTGNAAANLHHDEINRWLERHASALARIRTGLDELASTGAWVRTLTVKEVADIARAERPTGTCGNPACGRIVAQSRIDRLKAGLCPACYQADWRRRNPDGREAETVVTHMVDGREQGFLAS